MGAIDEISGEGRGALVTAGSTNNTAQDRQRARRKCADHALTTDNAAKTLRQLLNQLDLNPQEGEPR